MTWPAVGVTGVASVEPVNSVWVAVANTLLPFAFQPAAIDTVVKLNVAALITMCVMMHPLIGKSDVEAGSENNGCKAVELTSMTTPASGVKRQSPPFRERIGVASDALVGEPGTAFALGCRIVHSKLV